jgi:hypothetical protein
MMIPTMGVFPGGEERVGEYEGRESYLWVGSVGAGSGRRQGHRAPPAFHHGAWVAAAAAAAFLGGNERGDDFGEGGCRPRRPSKTESEFRVSRLRANGLGADIMQSGPTAKRRKIRYEGGDLRQGNWRGSRVPRQNSS